MPRAHQQMTPQKFRRLIPDASKREGLEMAVNLQHTEPPFLSPGT